MTYGSFVMERERSEHGGIHSFRLASKNENAGSMAGVSGLE
jgi:hypothetical protein